MPDKIQGRIHLRQREGLAIPLEGIGGISGRLVPMLFLEGGIVGAPLKEIDEGQIQVTKGLLKGDRRDIREPGVLLLESGKHGRKIVVVQTLAMLRIGRLARRETPVVDKAAASERLGQDDPLFLARIEAILVGALRLLAQLR